MSDQSVCKGYWNLTCDNETEQPMCSMMLEILSKLPKEMPHLFPAPPKVKKINKYCNLLVFTSDVSEEVIKSSAEVVRSNVDFPFIMYYLKINNPYLKNCCLYRHTPDGGLYKFTTEDNYAGSFWKLITGKNMEAATLFDKLLPSQVTVADKNTESAALFNELLPSQVTDIDHIHFPANKEDFEKPTNEKGGKWIVHCSDWETLDNYWKNLIHLYDTGGLVALKSCTVKFSISEIAPIYNTKAIKCYTADSDCKSSVKKAAQSIFISTGYGYDLYYKSNRASQDGLYRHEGIKSVSKYLFTSEGEMFERYSVGRWKKIIFDE